MLSLLWIRLEKRKQVSITHHARHRLWSFSIGLHELGESVECPLSIIVLDLVVLGVQFDGGEGRDLGMLQLVGCRVDLGDHDVGVSFEVLAELVVDRNQLLAVAAPEEKNIMFIFLLVDTYLNYSNL